MIQLEIDRIKALKASWDEERSFSSNRYKKEQLRQAYVSITGKKGVRSKFPKNTPQAYKSYAQRALNKNIEFVFSLEQFNDIIALACTYCGAIPANGIDRIDSKQGYTISNSVPCCKHCNMMKYTYSPEFFLEHIRKICVFNNKI